MVSIFVPSRDAAPRQDSASVEPSGRSPCLAAPSTGSLFYLGSVGLVAAGIVAVFFGTGLSLLVPPAGGMAPRSAARPGAEVAFVQPSQRNDEQATSMGRTDTARSTATLPPPAEEPAISGDDALPRRAQAEALASQAPQNTPAALADAAVPAPTPVASTALTQPASGLSPSEIRELSQHGDSLLRIGDVASARLFYERAAAAGDGRAALRLGATFDPALLERLGVGKLQADAAEARSWYNRALDLGAIEAKPQLKGLETRQGK
jgi:hypothetical protein